MGDRIYPHHDQGISYHTSSSSMRASICLATLCSAGEMLLRRLLNGHRAGDIDQIQAADNPLLAADRHGDGGDFLLLPPAAEVFAIAVLAGAGEDRRQPFRFAGQLILSFRTGGQHADDGVALRVGAKASHVSPEAVSNSGSRRPTIAR